MAKNNLTATQHNHMTRVILPRGKCPKCDEHHARVDDFYKPQPATERREPIRAALRVLADPEIPDEHADKNHNCGECWSCIEGSIALIGFARKQRGNGS